VVTASGVSLTNAAALAEAARPMDKAISYKELAGAPWNYGAEQFTGQYGVITSNSVWTYGSEHVTGGIRTGGSLTIGDGRLTGLETVIYGDLSRNGPDVWHRWPVAYGYGNDRGE
jgi:hypothetical protein